MSTRRRTISNDFAKNPVAARPSLYQVLAAGLQRSPAQPSTPKKAIGWGAPVVVIPPVDDSDSSDDEEDGGKAQRRRVRRSGV